MNLTEKIKNLLKNRIFIWVLKTVSIGLIPIFIRIIIYFVLHYEDEQFELLSSSEILLFGLVLNIVNIQDSGNNNPQYEHIFQMSRNTSIVAIIFFTILYGLSLQSSVNIYSQKRILVLAFIFSLITIVCIILRFLAEKNENESIK
jgi:FtsH-binding integral membrane protein